MTGVDWRVFEGEMLAFIAVAEAGWRGSPCWHVVDWMAWKLRIRYPLVPINSPIIGDVTS